MVPKTHRHYFMVTIQDEIPAWHRLDWLSDFPQRLPRITAFIDDLAKKLAEHQGTDSKIDIMPEFI